MLETRPLVTVAMPVFNAEKYLEEAIQSILDQTFANFELIIIDDGSSDGSLQLLKRFRDSDRRIRLIKRENRGISSTVNEILDLAQGQYFALMHADDIAMSRRLEYQVKWMEKTGADICGTWAQLFGTTDHRILRHAQTDAAIKLELLFCCAFANPTVMMKTQVIKSLRYDSDWDSAEDYELWVRAACAGYTMTNLPKVLLQYRLHMGQISSSSHNLQQELSQKIKGKYWTFLAPSIGLSADEVDSILKLREQSISNPNLKLIDSCFNKLLKKTSGEGRLTVFDQITRLYFRMAYCSLKVPILWLRLKLKFKINGQFKSFLAILFLSLLKVKPSSKIFVKLKKLYFQFSEKWSS